MRMEPPKETNFKRLIAAALFIAQKVLQDHGRWSLDQFSQISTIKASHLSKLEVTFCFCLGFELHLTKKEYSEFRENVITPDGTPVTAMENAYQCDHLLETKGKGK